MKVDLEQRLINPPPGSALESARKFGIDLSLLAERLRLSPEERLRDLQQVMRALEQIRAAARSST
jgi:aspartyl/asparaginyl beta-hydroxylase (cupin superfamily)